MLKAVWTIAGLDLLLWLRMPLALMSAILPPIGMAMLLLVLSLAVTQQPVALVIGGQGNHAEKMAKIIRADDDAYLLTITDAASAARMLADQEVAAVITIPEDFDSAVSGNGIGRVLLELNNVDIDFADDIRRSVDRSVAQFDSPNLSLAGEHGDLKEGLQSNSSDGKKGLQAPFGTSGEMTKAQTQPQLSDLDKLREAEELKEQEDEKQRLKAVEGNPYLIGIEEHDLRQTNVKWLNYQLIPVLVLLVLNVGLTGTALLCGQDIERKSSRLLLLSPQYPWLLVAGRLLGGFIAALLALIPSIGICLITGVISPPANHWIPLLEIFAATALCASGFGAILGTTLGGARTIAMAASVTSSYLFFLGGGFTTIAFLPQWLRTMSSFIPIRYSIDGMRQALFYTSLDGINHDLLVLCTTAIIACLLGSLLVRRSWN